VKIMASGVTISLGLVSLAFIELLQCDDHGPGLGIGIDVMFSFTGLSRYMNLTVSAVVFVVQRSRIRRVSQTCSL
jgi:hypothetical protein